MSQETNQDNRKKTTRENETEEKIVHKAEHEVRERPRKQTQHRPVQEEVGGVEQFAEQFKEDRMFAGYIIGGVIILLAIIIIAVYAASSEDSTAKKPETKVEEQETATEEETPVDVTAQDQTAEAATEPAEPEFVDDGSLQEDAYEDVNALVKEYFDAMANGDGDKIMQLKSDTSEEELLKLETKSAYIEGYENIKVYTKLGPVDSSYVAFVSYDINFKDVKKYANLLKDKIVLLGTFSNEEDAHFTPLGKMPGMKIQAYSMLSYIQNRNIQDMPIWFSLLIAFVLCYISSWVNYWVPRLWPKVDSYIISAYYFLIAALLVWVSFLSFMHLQYNINLLYPLAGIALIESARSLYEDSVRLIYNKWHWRIFKHSIYLEGEEE